MISDDYDIEDIKIEGANYSALVDAVAAISRVDERAARSPLLCGWQERLLFDEAMACQLAEGNLVHMEDLLLLDGEGRCQHTHPDLLDTLLMLRTWRRAAKEDAAALLRDDRPGGSHVAAIDASEMLRTPIRLRGIRAGPPIGEQPQTDMHALTRWRRILRASDQLPALLAAAVVWDMWRNLAPVPGAGWRGSLLAALVLRQRGVCASFLLPIDTGRRLTAYRAKIGETLDERLMGMVGWMHAAATRAYKQLDALSLAESQMLRCIAARRRRSRLRALIDLFISRPLVSIPLAARRLDCSTQAIEKMLPLLGSTPVLMTERKRFRAWRVA